MDKSKRERKVASRWRNFKRMLLIKRNLYCLSKYQTNKTYHDFSRYDMYFSRYDMYFPR